MNALNYQVTNNLISQFGNKLKDSGWKFDRPNIISMANGMKVTYTNLKRKDKTGLIESKDKQTVENTLRMIFNPIIYKYDRAYAFSKTQGNSLSITIHGTIA